MPKNNKHWCLFTWASEYNNILYVTICYTIFKKIYIWRHLYVCMLISACNFYIFVQLQNKSYLYAWKFVEHCILEYISLNLWNFHFKGKQLRIRMNNSLKVLSLFFGAVKEHCCNAYFVLFCWFYNALYFANFFRKINII